MRAADVPKVPPELAEFLRALARLLVDDLRRDQERRAAKVPDHERAKGYA